MQILSVHHKILSAPLQKLFLLINGRIIHHHSHTPSQNIIDLEFEMNTSVAEREIKLEVLSKVINKWSTITILSTRTDRPGANSVDPDLQFNTDPFVFWTHQQVVK